MADRELVLRFFDRTGFQADVERRFLTLIQDRIQRASPVKADRLRRIQERAVERLPELVENAVEVYVANFSDEEVQAALDYFCSPQGISFQQTLRMVQGPMIRFEVAWGRKLEAEMILDGELPLPARPDQTS